MKDGDEARHVQSNHCRSCARTGAGPLVIISSQSMLAGARFALRCWLCSASADVVMGRVYGALLVAMLVVCCVCAESGCV